MTKLEAGISQSQAGESNLDLPHSFENQTGISGGNDGYLTKSSQRLPRVRKKFMVRAAKLIGLKASKALINFDIIGLGKKIIISCQNNVQLRKIGRGRLDQNIFWSSVVN